MQREKINRTHSSLDCLRNLFSAVGGHQLMIWLITADNHPVDTLTDLAQCISSVIIEESEIVNRPTPTNPREG